MNITSYALRVRSSPRRADGVHRISLLQGAKLKSLILLGVAGVCLLCCNNFDDRGGEPPLCDAGEQLPTPPGYVCSSRRSCSRRSDMIVSCASDGYCDCNLPDGRMKRFKATCGDLEVISDECVDDP